MRGTPTVIFDFDGTLANSVDLLVRLYNEHSEEFGYQSLTADEFPSLRRLSYKKAMKRKGIRYRMLPRMIVTLGREMRQRMNEVKPYEGIIEVIEQLKSKGFSVGVLTSNQAPLVQDFFAEHGFPDFDFVVSEKTLFGKDKALKRIIEQHDLQRESVIYVGDEPRDVVACKKAKVTVVGVTWGLGGKEGFESEPPDVSVSTMKELSSAILDRLQVEQ